MASPTDACLLQPTHPIILGLQALHTYLEDSVDPNPEFGPTIRRLIGSIHRYLDPNFPTFTHLHASSPWHLVHVGTYRDPNLDVGTAMCIDLVAYVDGDVVRFLHRPSRLRFANLSPDAGAISTQDRYTMYTSYRVETSFDSHRRCLDASSTQPGKQRRIELSSLLSVHPNLSSSGHQDHRQIQASLHQEMSDPDVASMVWSMSKHVESGDPMMPNPEVLRLHGRTILPLLPQPLRSRIEEAIRTHDEEMDVERLRFYRSLLDDMYPRYLADLVDDERVVRWTQACRRFEDAWYPVDVDTRDGILPS